MERNCISKKKLCWTKLADVMVTENVGAKMLIKVISDKRMNQKRAYRIELEKNRTTWNTGISYKSKLLLYFELLGTVSKKTISNLWVWISFGFSVFSFVSCFCLCFLFFLFASIWVVLHSFSCFNLIEEPQWQWGYSPFLCYPSHTIFTTNIAININISF